MSESRPVHKRNPGLWGIGIPACGDPDAFGRDVILDAFGDPDKVTCTGCRKALHMDDCTPGVRCRRTEGCIMAHNHVPPCLVEEPKPCPICGAMPWEGCEHPQARSEPLPPTVDERSLAARTGSWRPEPVGDPLLTLRVSPVQVELLIAGVRSLLPAPLEDIDFENAKRWLENEQLVRDTLADLEAQLKKAKDDEQAT